MQRKIVICDMCQEEIADERWLQIDFCKQAKYGLVETINPPADLCEECAKKLGKLILHPRLSSFNEPRF